MVDTNYAQFLNKKLRRKKAAQHGMHADGWILTAKLAFFVALGFVRFVSESRPASRKPSG